MYALAKEIQILKPHLFSNIFLGLGPFHMEKIVMACLEKFLACSGIDTALVESGVFGKDVVNKRVMTGGHYIMSKEGMMLIADAVNSLLFKTFKASCRNCEEIKQIFEDYEHALQKIAEELNGDNENDFRLAWEQAKLMHQQLSEVFQKWKNTNMSNENVQYWVLYLDVIYPILRDLTHSIRVGDW